MKSMKNVFSIFLLSILALNVLSCKISTSDDAKVTQQDTPPSKRLNWDSIPSEYHPTVEELTFNTQVTEKIEINFFGFKDDVELIYSQDVKPDSMSLRYFTVWSESASWGSLSQSRSDKTLKLNQFGSYQCSIKTSNGSISSLKGGCYVRLQIFLPVGAQIEVYNVATLISNRFIAMSNTSLLLNLKNASFAQEKMDVINDFLYSYEVTSKKPALSSVEMGKVVYVFSVGEEKLTALRKLHSFVLDRENLSAMIEKEFSHFDKPEARKIVGL